ncbi:dihydrofolate reductase [Cereibacter sphaeroides]|uniref:dihydrofolate reductase n=1 Tax=Cereibacter sphaeroides TaxID=1063 RepID=UPI001F2DC8B2|nr:dihydrofolate reductase [Cereibacter sphaeroides]MCE6960543.1 dihydrofolate reductase [Cereibacter sphaeroides]MCE6969493.1 dihydrofolate reductase [Cereibacter sphaeroides]MCE6972776.1 dihydrofolate reductase [Cereibacter sphaeroides]
MLTLVVARARGGAIGKDGTIPWHAPEDLAFFQRETLGGAVIMGRRTWESLPKRPLPRRMNIVVTSGRGEGEALFTSFEAAIPAARAAGHARIYSIGGARIFAGHLPLADRLLVTEVDLEVEGADTFFPDFDADEWHCAARMELRRDAPGCVLYEYLRRR